MTVVKGLSQAEQSETKNSKAIFWYMTYQTICPLLLLLWLWWSTTFMILDDTGDQPLS